MTNVIIHGCGGKMGKVVERIVNSDPSCQVVAGIDPREGLTADYPVFKSVNDCTVKGDVIIDFSTASAIPTLLEQIHLPFYVQQAFQTSLQLRYTKMQNRLLF